MFPFIIKKRRNMRAWTDALFAPQKNCPILPDIRIYEKLTREQVANDCRIILESAEIIAQTKNPQVYAGRVKLMNERLAHLMTLKPFSEPSQHAFIKSAEQACKGIARR